MKKAEDIWPRRTSETWDTFNDLTYKPTYFEDFDEATRKAALDSCDNVSITIGTISF